MITDIAAQQPFGANIPPLITDIYSADPSAHVFGGEVYIYPSHDRKTSIKSDDNGDQYDMVDYHVFSTVSLDPHAPVIDHGVALRTEDIPWVSKQLWAPDAAFKYGKYFLYFPARDKEGLFRIGVAVADQPAGPFTADPEPINGSYSIDPAVFMDEDDVAYMYFGGLWGGQLQCYSPANGVYNSSCHGGPQEPSGAGVAALGPRVAKMSDDMHHFAEGSGSVRELVILAPETGKPLLADDHDRRFFEAPWMHKRGGTYYFSYSTGDTHYLVYATAPSPYGPFTYAGRILEPVTGWTTHHSIVEFKGRWWLFFHDAKRSGEDNLRTVKVTEIFYDAEGKIVLEKPK